MQCRGAVPLEWLVSHSSTQVVVLFAVLGLAVCTMGAWYVVDGQNDRGGWTMLTVGAGNLLVAALCGCAAKRNVHAFEGLVLLGFCLLATSTQCIAGFEDAFHKGYYLMGMSRFALKPVPVIIGMRPMTYVIFLTWCFVGDAVLLAWMQLKFGDEDSILDDYAILLVSTAAYIGMSRVASRWIGAVYQSSCQVSHVKEAQEVLLFTFCDATLWLGADADTIVHCDRRFGLMLGKAVEGTRLCEHVLQTPEELARLRAALQHLPADAHGPPPAALHVTVRGGDGGTLSLELRIADRRGSGSSRAEPASQPGDFLVGVRIEAGGVPGGQAPPPAAIHAAADVGGPTRGAAAGAPNPEEAPAGQDEEPPLPEFREAVVEFDTASPKFTLRRVLLHFAAPDPELQVPELVNLLPLPVGKKFEQWAQEHVNFALQGLSDECSKRPSDDFGPITLRVTQGLALASDSARLEVLEAEDDESLPARLHLRGLRQSNGSDFGQRRPPLPQPRLGTPAHLMPL